MRHYYVERRPAGPYLFPGRGRPGADKLSTEQARVMTAMARCRTAALGGHAHECSACGLVMPAYNSCRNRHCPKCQGSAQYRWIESTKERLLNTSYLSVVFTLPAELRPIAARNRRVVYALLMRSAASVWVLRHSLARATRCRTTAD